MPEELPWFNARNYASFEEYRQEPRRCIAPTKKEGWPRCLWTIYCEDEVLATTFLRRAEDLPNGFERDESIAQFLKLHCCDRAHHRTKLTEDRTGCLERLVNIYSSHINMVSSATAAMRLAGQTEQIQQSVPTPSPSGKHPQTVKPEVVKLEVVESKVTKLSSQTTDGGIQLRSGTTINGSGELPWSFYRKNEYFQPYKTDPSDTLSSELFKPVNANTGDEGEVYSFVWPDYPDYVKIGYGSYSLNPSSRSWQMRNLNPYGGLSNQRLRSWQTCNPGATLFVFAAVQYPARIERLIHLELAEYRYKIGRCRYCPRTHEEYFKVSAEHVKEVLIAWTSLSQREALYDGDRCLTVKWEGRIKRCKGPITAKALHKLLDEEKLVKSDEPMVEVKPAPVSRSEPQTNRYNSTQTSPVRHATVTIKAESPNPKPQPVASTQRKVTPTARRDPTAPPPPPPPKPDVVSVRSNIPASTRSTSLPSAFNLADIKAALLHETDVLPVDDDTSTVTTDSTAATQMIKPKSKVSQLFHRLPIRKSRDRQSQD